RPTGSSLDRFVSSVSIDCNYLGQNDFSYNPPALRAPGPGFASVPTCLRAKPGEMQPGTYDSALALNTFFAQCAGQRFTFATGVYYFDFTDLPPASHLWT